MTSTAARIWHKLSDLQKESAVIEQTGEFSDFHDVLHDVFYDFVSPKLRFHYDPSKAVSSTQDAMRQLLDRGAAADVCHALVAREQTAGRGTNGRVWQAGTGNLYLTVAVPQNRDSPMIKPITLFPLQVAIVVAQSIESMLSILCQSSEDTTLPRPVVKWPNDVLLGEKNQKVSGCLIESHSSSDCSQQWFLVGIGVNIATSPDIQSLPGQHRRPPISAYEFCVANNTATELLQHELVPILLGLNIANMLADWSMSWGNDDDDKAQVVLSDYRSYAKFGEEYELRGSIVAEEDGSYQGEIVTTIDVEADGRLKVRGQDGRERLLVAEYLF